MKTLTILLVLLTATSAWGQADWGGASYYQDDADSVYMNYLDASNVDSNNGAQVVGVIKADFDQNIIIRPAVDPRTADSDDSAHLVIDIDESNVSSFWAPAESMMVYVYVMQRAWGEGTKIAAASSTGESDWEDAVEGTTAWATAGGIGTGDREATAIDSFWVDSLTAHGEVANVITITIPGSKVDDVFSYGLMLDNQRDVGGPGQLFFHSDDASTAGTRPYFEGWQTSASTPSTTMGGNTTVGGGVTMGGGQ